MINNSLNVQSNRLKHIWAMAAHCLFVLILLLVSAQAFSATLVAHYAMEESAWNGSANELKDAASYGGGPFDGQGIGTPKPTATSATPARAGSSGTCGYAEFSGARSGGSAFTMDNLPVSTSAGAKTSVSFWMYWDGTNAVMPLGWYRYGLIFFNGSFGFNTNYDLYGTNSFGLANGWHHVVAVFTNGNVASNQLYIDGVSRALTQRYGSTNNSRAQVQPTLQMGGWTFTPDYRLPGGRIDEVKIYNGAMTQAEVDADYSAVHACPGSVATPLAYYAMDENAWNGTASEVLDSVGGHNGTADSLALSEPTTANINPAIAGNPGTCRYGVFNRANKDYVYLPSSFPNLGAGGEAFTITAWIRTTNNSQSGQRILIDDESESNGYGFSLGDGGTGRLRIFSRGTPSALILDTANVIASNTWYFVAAVIDVPNKTKHLYVYNQLGSLLTHVNATWTEASFGFDAGRASIGGETNFSGEASSSFGFSGNIDELNVYSGVLNASGLDLVRQQTHGCPTYNITPANFNCIFVGGDSSTGRLYTQLASTAFSVDVVALKSDGTVETDYVTSSTKNVTLEWVDGTGTTACASRSALSPPVTQTVTFSAADTGRKTVSSTIAKANRNLRCRVTDANQSPSVVGCSSDNFAVRPTSFNVTSTANADGAGVSTTATPIVKAGANFSLTAATGVAGYDGTPSIDSSKLSAHIGAVQFGALTGSFGASSSTTGNAIGTTFNYSEAGYFRFAANGIFDSTFTAVDVANGDCTTGFSASGGINACSFGNTSVTNYFGRFYPDHFSITAGLTTPSCGNSFSYYGQDGLTTAFTLIAQNSANTITQNYAGGFAKLGLTLWNSYNFTAATLPAGAVLSASTTSPTGVWNNGSAAVSAKHIISRPPSASAPAGIILSAAPTDSDGVTVASTAVSTSSIFRYGRLSMPNTYGSELLALNVPVEAQYWNGTAYQKNQLDNCSVIPVNSIAMSNYKRNLSACETQLSGAGVISAGKTTFGLSAPGSGNDGSVDLSVNLNSVVGTTCNSATTTNAISAATPWFGNSNPSARASFGLYKSPMIYLRENF
jgi:MSHA biogenesis protein MshQ